MEIITTTTCLYFNPVNLKPEFDGEQADYEFTQSVCNTTKPISSSTTAGIYNGFTQGEIIISLFLFFIFMAGIFSVFWFGVLKPHIHRIHKK